MNIPRLAKILALLLFLISCPRLSDAADLTLAWDAPSDGVTTGYIIYVGQAPQTYSQQINVGFVTSFTVTGLSDGTAYYFTVRGYDAMGALSGPSNEVTATTPPAITGLTISSNIPSPQAVGTTIMFTATATGGVTPYEFQFSLYASQQWTVSPWSTASTTTWTPSTPGADYQIRVAVRSSGSSSANGDAVRALPFIITAGVSRINVAAAANGGTALASTTYSGNYAPSGAIDGEHKGLGFGAGGGWADGTPNAFPDWFEVDFNGAKTINEVDVFTLQDNFQTPGEPTPTMSFSLYGVTSFQVQYWTGTQWLQVPGGTVSGNNLVWRQIKFGALTTARIRVFITGALTTFSRLTEVEAYEAPNTIPPTVSLTSPANGAALTGPVAITVSANASDSDGSVSSVAFYANATPIGALTTSPYSLSWSPAPGTYTLTAIATDNLGAITTSAPVNVTVTGPGGRLNVAAAANGGTALASTTYSGNYAPSGAIDGEHKGLGFGAGGGWADGTPNAFPDWFEVDFNGVKTINEVDVFTLQDNYQAPSEPTPTMSFSLYGVTDFQVQYWTGTQWLPVPGGTVSGNNLVWRQITFGALTTDRIRVFITGALVTFSRLTEVEVYSTSDPPISNFSIDVNPTSLTFVPGGSGTSEATVIAVGGFSGSVGLTVTGCPSGATCSLPTPVTPSPTATSTLSVSTTTSTSRPRAPTAKPCSILVVGV